MNRITTTHPANNQVNKSQKINSIPREQSPLHTKRVNYEMDSLEISADDAEEEVYITYAKPIDTTQIKAHDKSHIRFVDESYHPEVSRIYDYMMQGFQDYMTGKIGAEEVSDIIENMYKDMLAYNVSLGLTDGNDLEFNAIVLKDTQANFIMRGLDSAYYLGNQLEGDAFAKANNGLTPEKDNYVYYNAKYYYANEDFKEICNSTIARMAKDEGLTDYRVSQYYEDNHPNWYDFNCRWSLDSANNAHAAKMKDFGAKPPKDFVMYFTPNRYSSEDRENGTWYNITANDPQKTGGLTGWDFMIKVPRGASLFKTNLLSLIMTRSNNDYCSGVFDITKYTTPGALFKSSLEEFFAKNVTDFIGGELVLWQNGAMSEHNVPFEIFFDNKRMFNGSEVSSDGGFINNFEFHQYIRYHD